MIYLPEPHTHTKNKIEVELDLTNHAKKSGLKNTTAADTLDFAKKHNLDNLKSDVDKLDTDKLKNGPNRLKSLRSKVNKLDIDKLEITPVDLRDLNDLVKNAVVKKTK